MGRWLEACSLPESAFQLYKMWPKQRGRSITPYAFGRKSPFPYEAFVPRYKR